MKALICLARVTQTDAIARAQGTTSQALGDAGVHGAERGWQACLRFSLLLLYTRGWFKPAPLYTHMPPAVLLLFSVGTAGS